MPRIALKNSLKERYMKNWMGLLMNEVNELFTKENVEQIVVPQVVKDDLLSIIEEKLKEQDFTTELHTGSRQLILW